MSKSTKKQTILLLTPRSLGIDRCALDEEARAIQLELERSCHRDEFELVTRWASRPLDLLRELRRLKPTIVQLSGRCCCGNLREHQLGWSTRRDVVLGYPDGGLIFQGPDGLQFVSAGTLAQTFGATGASVRLVVLSTCYSDEQADALLMHVDCVVGLTGSISDNAARNFAIGFYGGLGERESVAAAYRQGCAAISLEGLPGREEPRIKVRTGIDADQLVLSRAGELRR
jgi:hypothetical protein